MKSSNKLGRQAKSLKHTLGGSTYFLSTLLVFLFCLCELLPMPAFKINQPVKLKYIAEFDKANVWGWSKYSWLHFFPELGLEFPWGWCILNSGCKMKAISNIWKIVGFLLSPFKQYKKNLHHQVQLYFGYLKIWMEARFIPHRWRRELASHGKASSVMHPVTAWALWHNIWQQNYLCTTQLWEIISAVQGTPATGNRFESAHVQHAEVQGCPFPLNSEQFWLFLANPCSPLMMSLV